MTHDELLAKIDSLNDSCSVADRLATSLRAVVELHKPSNKGFDWMPKNLCDVCLEEGQEYEPALDVDYPCPTIQAVEKELS